MDYSAYPRFAHWLRQPGFGLAALRLALQVHVEDDLATWPTPALHAAGFSSPAIEVIRTAGLPRAREHREAEWLAREQVLVLSLGDDDYPPLLRQLASPPPWLFLRGTLSALQSPQLAMVGTRKPTPAGVASAHHLARDLSLGGLTITSGLAIGIDTASHRGALEGSGASVAVIGCGPDRVYPHRNRALADQLLAAGGAVVSEFLPGTAPAPANFPRRNRIISGLSLGVLVVEAALPSGSLITAQFAAEQNREVLAMPGSAHSRVSRGSNDLLRHGATLVETPEDVIEALSFHAAWRPRPSSEPPTVATTDPLCNPVLAAIGLEPTSLSIIVERTGLQVSEVAVALMALELDGLIEQSGGCAQRTTSALAGWPPSR